MATRISISDFKEDPANDAAFAIMFDLTGPGDKYDLVTVYFTDAFIQEYFQVRWYKNLPDEEHRLVNARRDLFVKWALIKVEKYIKDKCRDSKIIIDSESDGIWARKVEGGRIQPAGIPQEEEYTWSFR